MRFFVVLSVIFLGVSCDEEYTCANVAQVDSNNADSEMSKHKLTLMLFYAPWCGHCKRLMPDYDTVCKSVKEAFGSDALCARVDCTTSEDICDRQKLRGYPTIKAFKGKDVCEFEGPREGDSIFRWFRSLYHSSQDVENIATARQILASSETSLVAFVYPESEMRSIVSTISCKISDTTFLVVSDPVIAKELGFSEPDTFALFKKDSLHRILEGQTKTEDILLSVFFFVNPILPQYAPESAPRIFSNLLSHYMAYIYDTDQSLADIREVLEKYAESKIPSLRVFTINASDEANRDVVNYFNLEKIPNVVFYDDSKQKNYHMGDKEIAPESLDAFVKGCLDGTISPYVKKQPAPEGWDQEAVKVLVVDTFPQVFQKYRAGIVLFYAPWCGHCEAFMPTWDQLGDYVKENHPDIFVGKMDHTQNEMEGIEISGYPTVIAFDTIEKQIPYNGGRSMDDLKKFILETFYQAEKDEKEMEGADREDL